MQEPVSIAAGILGVVRNLWELRDKLAKGKRDRRDRIARLFDDVSECLAAVSATFRQGNVPHGRCGELAQYADQLAERTGKELGQDKADELAARLKEAHDVERLVSEPSFQADPEKSLAQIEEASGSFRGLANLLRAA